MTNSKHVVQACIWHRTKQIYKPFFQQLMINSQLWERPAENPIKPEIVQIQCLALRLSLRLT